MTIILSDRGIKHTCANCQIRFFDMTKNPASCPKCNHVVKVIAPPVKRKRRTIGDDSTAMERSSALHVVIAEPKPKRPKWKI